MTDRFHELLLSELHMAVFVPGEPEALTDELLCKAVTLNENLQTLGYILRPDDLIRLAESPSMYEFYNHIRSLVPDVKAEPMYPGFPQQVMNMSVAEFRMHQMIHYFSTYGLESLLGNEVRRGWLPDYEGHSRIRNDSTLLESKVIELITDDRAAYMALKTILNRRERLTNPELELVTEAASLCEVNDLKGLCIRFKENLDLLFPKLMQLKNRQVAFEILQTICLHSGDVLRCTHAYLSGKRWHLTTSEKRLLVKLLESYSVWNLRENLMKSRLQRERNLIVLQYLDYNRFSRSEKHREVVRALRNDELLSWHGVGEKLLREKDPEALTHLCERPGFMLRMLNRLLSLGYTDSQILGILLPKADSLSGHLILKAIRSLSGRREKCHTKYIEEKCDLDAKYLQMSYQLSDEAIQFEYEWKTMECIQKYNAEEECLTSENIYREYQENVRQLKRQAQVKRLEVNTECLENVKKDAESQIMSRFKLLEKVVLAKEGDLRSLEEEIRLQKELHGPERRSLVRNATMSYDAIISRYFLYGDSYAQVLRDELNELYDRLTVEKEVSGRLVEQAFRDIEVRNGIFCADRIDEIDRWEQEELGSLHQRYIQGMSDRQKNIKDVSLRKEEELSQLRNNLSNTIKEAKEKLCNLEIQKRKEEAEIEGRYQSTLRMCKYDEKSVKILKELLKEHFRRITTPLRGKKIFCDLKKFDLSHSSLETEDRSKDGGYIRSGISWKIPDKAKYVRFFVYWNDQSRVDVDLHAGGVKIDGSALDIGWSSDFCDCGVVFSGDITHSDAAEYIDIDLSAPVKEIYANVNLFSGKKSFREIDTCYLGLMAVNHAKQNVDLYNPKNCFFTHRLSQNTRNLFYGYIDVQRRFVRFIGQPNRSYWAAKPEIENEEKMFSMQDYLDCVLEGQDAIIVDRAENADVILTMGKGMNENSISLVDNNFFLES